MAVLISVPTSSTLYLLLSGEEDVEVEQLVDVWELVEDDAVTLEELVAICTFLHRLVFRKVQRSTFLNTLCFQVSNSSFARLKLDSKR